MPVAIVTGANIGLGFETAKELARAGYHVVITSRDQRRADHALERLGIAAAGAKVSSLPLDLSKMQSINDFAQVFSEKFGSWNLLVLNAGAKVLKDFSTTDFGVEYHYGVNAVGHFALTADLIPSANQIARVISVSSIIARFAPSQMGPVGSQISYSPGASYAASKLSNYLFGIELQERFGSENFSSVIAHPGFARAEPYGPKSTRFFESFLAQSAASGAKPIIQACLAKDIPGGSYLGPKYLELWGDPKLAKVPKLATAENQKINWEILEKLSGRLLR
jgi:NAD(P)-dependent dehydrogenase (short-subunit alcohol dehydrogenase family)